MSWASQVVQNTTVQNMMNLTDEGEDEQAHDNDDSYDTYYLTSSVSYVQCDFG